MHRSLGWFGLILAFLLHLLIQSQAASVAHENQSTGQDTVTAKSQEQDEEQQLEKLKGSGKNVAVYKSQVQTVSNVNGKVNAVSEKKERIEDAHTGQTIAQVSQEAVESQTRPEDKPDKLVKTVVDVPAKGLHRTSVTHNGKAVSPQRIAESKEFGSDDYYTPVQGIQYTPADMADYIYRTGDEDGVTLAIEELMREGVMSQDDAISYLEEVKMDLEILRAGNERKKMRQLGMNDQGSQEEKLAEALRLKNQQSQMLKTQRLSDGPLENSVLGTFQRMDEKRQNMASRLEAFRRKGLVAENDNSYDVKDVPSRGEIEADYEDVVERLRLADFLSKEFSLEGIIYQLAKEMFTQSVLRGNNDAEEALQRFSDFLQQEAMRGRISPQLQKKVIDVMLAALVDTVGEHPELSALQPGPVMMESSEDHSKATEEGKSKVLSLQAKQKILNAKSGNEEQLTLDKSFKPKTISNPAASVKKDSLKKA